LGAIRGLRGGGWSLVVVASSNSPWERNGEKKSLGLLILIMNDFNDPLILSRFIRLVGKVHKMALAN